MNRRNVRHAFTLIEVVVGLMVMSMVVVLARAILGSISDTRARISVASAANDERNNADRLLHALIGSITQVDSASFTGTPLGASFRSSCRSAGGWAEPCDVRLAIHSDSVVMSVSFGTAKELVVRSGFRSASLSYLSSARNGGQWLPAWSSSNATAPLAVGIVVERDTSIFPLGEFAW